MIHLNAQEGENVSIENFMYRHELMKSNIKLTTKEINTKEAEKIISEFNNPNQDQTKISKSKSSDKNKTKSKKISKK